MSKIGLTFGKAEHLKSKKVMDEVFSKGKIVKKYPLLLKYSPCTFEAGAKVQIVISVPKRKIRRATGRNRVRRQIKEAYRLNKVDLIKTVEGQKDDLALFLIYTGEEKGDYKLIESNLKVI